MFEWRGKTVSDSAGVFKFGNAVTCHRFGIKDRSVHSKEMSFGVRVQRVPVSLAGSGRFTIFTRLPCALYSTSSMML